MRIERLTTWPNGNRWLSAIEDEILIDLGADRESETDDIWLFLHSEVRFNGGASLAREIDLRIVRNITRNRHLQRRYQEVTGRAWSG